MLVHEMPAQICQVALLFTAKPARDDRGLVAALMYPFQSWQVASGKLLKGAKQ